MRGDEYFIALSGKNMNINQMPFTKYVMLFALGCGLLTAGILIGFWIGQTSFGALLPHLLAVGTVTSFMTAVYFAIYHPNSRQDMSETQPFFCFP